MRSYLVILLLVSFYTAAFSQQMATSTILIDSPVVFKIKSQPHFFINIHGGYATGLGSTFKFYPDDISSISIQKVNNNPETRQVYYKEHAKGLGEGFRFGLGLSYIINDFVNVGIDVDYFKSTINKIRDSSYHMVNTLNGGMTEISYDEKYNISYEAALLTFSPNITFKAISKPKFFIYNKVGAVIIFRPNSIQRESQRGNYLKNFQGSVKDSSLLNEKRYDWGIRNPTFGFMGGIGAQARVSEKIRVFAEVQFTHVVFKVRDRVLTNYKVNGKEMVNTLPLSARKIVFKENFTSTDTDTSPDSPTIATYQRFPITYVGLQTGIAYRF